MSCYRRRRGWQIGFVEERQRRGFPFFCFGSVSRQIVSKNNPISRSDWRSSWLLEAHVHWVTIASCTYSKLPGWIWLNRTWNYTHSIHMHFLQPWHFVYLSRYNSTAQFSFSFRTSSLRAWTTTRRAGTQSTASDSAAGKDMMDWRWMMDIIGFHRRVHGRGFFSMPSWGLLC